MQRHVRTIVLLALAVPLATPVAAAEPGWTVRLHGAWSKPNIEASRESRPSRSRSAATAPREAVWASSTGFDPGSVLAWTRSVPDPTSCSMPTCRAAGVESRMASASRLQPWSVFHLTPGRAIDLTVAPMLGLAVFGNLRFAAEGRS